MMKKNATPELSAKWWSSNEPDGLSSSKDLAKALGAYESASASLKKDGGEDEIDECLEALTKIESAAQKLQSEAEKLVKSPPKKTTSTTEDYQNTAEALKKYAKIVEAARKEKEQEKEALAKSAEDEEGEEEDQEAEGLLNDEPKYTKYLRGAMKKLLKAPMAFAFGLGKKPEEHRFLCHKSKAGAALFKTLKGETELTKGTFGMAGAHELEAGVLTLALEGKQIGALKKKGELFLKYFKPLPFHTILLMVDGEIVEDLPDEDDVPPPPPGPKAESDLLARLTALTPRIKEFATAADAAGKAAGEDLEAKKAALAPRNRLLTLVRDCKGMIGTNDEQAEAMLAEIEQILKTGQGAVPPPPPGPKAESGLLARLNALTPRIKEFATAADAAGKAAGADLEAKKVALAPRNRLLTLVRDCQGMNGKNDEQAEAMLAEIEEILKTGQGDLPPTKAPSTVDWATAKASWQDASDTIDSQIAKLQSVLKKSDNPDLVEIAEFGLNAVTGNFKVPLMAAIRDIDSAVGNARSKAARKALDIIKGFRQHIVSSEQVTAVDNNPFGVDLSIRSTLSDAFAVLENVLQPMTST